MKSIFQTIWQASITDVLLAAAIGIIVVFLIFCIYGALTDDENSAEGD